MNKPMHIKQQSPAATVNDFLFLEPATEKTGFQTIIRSSKAILPNGPKFIPVPPQPELAGVDMKSTDASKTRFKPWDTVLELQPWTKEERIALGLPAEPQKGDKVPLPPVDNPVLWRHSFVNP